MEILALDGGILFVGQTEKTYMSYTDAKGILIDLKNKIESLSNEKILNIKFGDDRIRTF